MSLNLFKMKLLRFMNFLIKNIHKCIYLNKSYISSQHEVQCKRPKCKAQSEISMQETREWIISCQKSDTCPTASTSYVVRSDRPVSCISRGLDESSFKHLQYISRTMCHFMYYITPTLKLLLHDFNKLDVGVLTL